MVTPDRPGLLAHLARIFVRFELCVLKAKISTLGERVEDIFYLTDRGGNPLANDGLIKTLKETICEELDQRNQEAEKDFGLRKMKIWQ